MKVASTNRLAPHAQKNWLKNMLVSLSWTQADVFSAHSLSAGSNFRTTNCRVLAILVVRKKFGFFILAHPLDPK